MSSVKYDLNLFFTLSLDLLSIRGADGHFQQLNPAWEKILGWTLEELRSRPWIEFVHPDDVRVSVSAETRCAEEIVEYENRYLHKDGSYCLLSWRVSRDANGLFYAVAKDITAAKHAQTALRDRREFERLITSLSTEFINLSWEEIDGGLKNALRVIGEFSDFDRSYVALFSEDGSEANIVYEWYAESVKSLRSVRPRYSTETFSWWMTKLKNFETVQISGISELPSEADSVRLAMQEADAKSAVAVPMVQGKSVIGYIGFAAVKQEKILSDEVVALLRIVGEIFTNALSRKQTQEKLRQQEAQLQHILDAANIGFWNWNIQTGTVTWSNNLERLFGLTPHTFDGKFETFLATVHPKDRDRINQATQHSLETGEDSNTEFRVVWPDGSIRWMESKGRVFFNEAGQPVRATGINFDITERKLAEEQLRQSEEELRLALDAANMGFWHWNIQTGTVTWSSHFKRILGLPPDTPEGSYELFLSRVHPEDRDRVHQASLRSLEMREDGDSEYRIVWPDGSIHWIESKFKFFYDETGQPIRKTGIDLDVSDRKLAEIQIQESLREKEVLLQEVHHRVKNNLQIISSLLDLQSHYIKDRATIEVLEGSCIRIKSMALVHEKLYQAKNFRKIDFADYIRSLTNELLQVYSFKSGKICLELDVAKLFLNINTAIPCGLIISELVSNAFKHAFPDSTEGKITVALHAEDIQQFTLIVKDSGKGLPRDFDFRLLKSLGLQLVNILTQQLGGTLEVSHSMGTEFRIRFSETN